MQEFDCLSPRESAKNTGGGGNLGLGIGELVTLFSTLLSSVDEAAKLSSLFLAMVAGE